MVNKCFTNIGPFEIIPGMSRKLLVLLALSLIVILIGYRVSGLHFDWALFLSSLSGMKPGWIAASVLLTMATLWVRAVRWQVLLAPLKAVRLGPLLSITVVGFSAIFLLGRAGEVARPLWLSRREKVTLTGSIATIVVERMLDSIMLILVFVGALFWAETPETSSPTLAFLKNRAWIIAGVAGAALATLLILRLNAVRVVRLIPFRRIASWVDSFLEGLSFIHDGRSLALVMLQSAVLWIVIILQFWMMLRGMNFSVSAGAATLVMVVSAIGSAVQIPGVGGGFQAGYIFCMNVLLRIPFEQAVATALLAFVLSFGPVVALAPLFMMNEGFSLRELKAWVRKPESEPL